MKSLILIVVIFLTGLQQILAQGCSVCTQTTAGMGAESAQGLNNGIIYLAAIPLIFLVTVGYLWYRHNKHTI